MFAFDKPLTWIIILVIVLLIFGAGKLPDIGRSLGRSIKEFKDETTNGMEGDKPVSTTTTTTTPVTPGVPVATTSVGSAAPTPTIRRRIIKHPDGREEVIEEPIA